MQFAIDIDRRQLEEVAISLLLWRYWASKAKQSGKFVEAEVLKVRQQVQPKFLRCRTLKRHLDPCSPLVFREWLLVVGSLEVALPGECVVFVANAKVKVRIEPVAKMVEITILAGGGVELAGLCSCGKQT
ncbi:hypothetical protein PS928_06242 [Pseudomonas fluorescens]|uniref:Uncharacterized protein n=1 Tax=Pseudomonas fluorescens TaxID=294 RepID=A0A5E7VT45_PSEFL|nr:hypothetical protein PS928_06242 [Pseudomonas fluorescens]